MGRPRIYPNPENGTLEELKETSRVGSIETSTRCTAIQLLITGVEREMICQALLITERALRKWINVFNEKGVDGLIVKKRPGRTSIAILKNMFLKYLINALSSKKPAGTAQGVCT
jgi:hypothetical protein